MVFLDTEGNDLRSSIITERTTAFAGATASLTIYVADKKMSNNDMDRLAENCEVLTQANYNITKPLYLAVRDALPPPENGKLTEYYEDILFDSVSHKDKRLDKCFQKHTFRVFSISSFTGETPSAQYRRRRPQDPQRHR